MFADDSQHINAAAHIADIGGIINHDLQLLTNWARQWLVTYNPLKPEAAVFALKEIDFFPQLVFDNLPIFFVDSHKRHLGVILILLVDSGTRISKTVSIKQLNFENNA